MQSWNRIISAKSRPSVPHAEELQVVTQELSRSLIPELHVQVVLILRQDFGSVVREEVTQELQVVPREVRRPLIPVQVVLVLVLEQDLGIVVPEEVRCGVGKVL